MPDAAEHAHAADRFAREIIGILALSGAARSRRLMRNPLGGVARRMAGADPMMADESERGGLPLARGGGWRRGGS